MGFIIIKSVYIHRTYGIGTDLQEGVKYIIYISTKECRYYKSVRIELRGSRLLLLCLLLGNKTLVDVGNDT